MEQFKNKQILEKYKNFRQLAQGAISGIYYAEQVSDNQPVAIKIVTMQRIQDSEKNRYFDQELEVTKAIMAQGKNENIVNILELIEGDNEYFIVTEYCSDGDLLNLLERFSFRLQPEVAISFCIAIASGLRFLHQSKICHRDLKPENILIAKQSDGSFYIKISDFGISKQSDQMMKSTIGTITYMAPEILKYQDYDEKVDIWSLGCLIYEIFVGEQLFAGNTMKDVVLKITNFNEDSLDGKSSLIPKSVVKLIKRCLKRLPIHRIGLDQIIDELVKIKAETKINIAQSMLISQNNGQIYNNAAKSVEQKIDNGIQSMKQKETNAIKKVATLQKVEDLAQTNIKEQREGDGNLATDKLKAIKGEKQQSEVSALGSKTNRSRGETEVVTKEVNSLEIVEINYQSDIKFTDNLNDSFVEVYDCNQQDEEGNQQDEASKIFVPASLFEKNNIDLLKAVSSEGELDYITPKNNTKQQDTQQMNNEKKLPNSQDSDKKLKILEEEKKYKKQEEKTKYNEYLQTKEQSNSLQQQNHIEETTHSTIEQSVVLEKQQNPYYIPAQLKMYSPQMAKNSNQQQSFLSENKAPYQQFPDLKQQQQDYKNQPISSFLSTQPSEHNNSNKLYIPSPSNQSTKNNSILSFDSYSNSQTGIQPIKNLQINEPHFTVPQIPLISSKLPEKTQVINPVQTTYPYPVQSSYLTQPISPVKKIYAQTINPIQTVYPVQTTYPVQKTANYTTSIESIRNQNLSHPSTAVQYKDQISQNNNVKGQLTMNQSQINNQSYEMQSILTMFSKEKDNPKQKRDIKLNGQENNQELLQNNYKLQVLQNAESYFPKDLGSSNYQFKNVFFPLLSAQIPCFEIKGIEDGYIIEFISFIHTSIKMLKLSFNVPAKEYIKVILANMNYYFTISDFLKKKQELLLPFLKVLLNIMEIYPGQDEKYEQLHEMTKSSLFKEFLKTFGNLLETFSDTHTQQLFLNGNSQEIQEIKNMIAHKTSFKLSKEEDGKRQQYFVNFNY